MSDRDVPVAWPMRWMEELLHSEASPPERLETFTRLRRCG